MGKGAPFGMLLRFSKPAPLSAAPEWSAPEATVFGRRIAALLTEDPSAWSSKPGALEHPSGVCVTVSHSGLSTTVIVSLGEDSTAIGQADLNLVVGAYRDCRAALDDAARERMLAALTERSS